MNVGGDAYVIGTRVVVGNGVTDDKGVCVVNGGSVGADVIMTGRGVTVGMVGGVGGISSGDVSVAVNVAVIVGAAVTVTVRIAAGDTVLVAVMMDVAVEIAVFVADIAATGVLVGLSCPTLVSTTDGVFSTSSGE